MMRWPYLLCICLLATPVQADDADTNGATGAVEADADMNQAIRLARTTLDDFLREFDSQPNGSSDFQLRVRVSDSRGSELVWFTQLQRSGSGFSGLIAHEPRVVALGNNQRNRFSRSDIIDWGYVSNGKQIGGYTVCATIRRMSQQQADLYRREYRFDCR